MKNLVQKSLLLSVVMVGHFAFADLAAEVIKKSGNLHALDRLSNAGSKLYEESFDYFLTVMQFRHSVTKGSKFDAKDFSVLRSTEKEGGAFASQLHSTKVDEDGTLIKVVADLPSVRGTPTKTEFARPWFGGGGGVLKPVSIRRTFDSPSSYDSVELEQAVLIKKLDDGAFYSMVPEMKISKGNQSAQASLVGGSTIHNREIGVTLETINPANQIRPLFYANGLFKLPAEIKGEVVTVNINLEGSRLTFTTTEGMEHTYAVNKNSDINGYNKLSFSHVASQKIAGGKKSLQARVKIIEGRNSKPVQGLDTEPMGSVGSAQ